MDPPAPETLMRALQLLSDLKALDDDGELTQIGSIMAEFPLEPQLSKVLLNSPTYRCSNEILAVVALLSSANIFMRPKENQREADEARNKFAHPDGDHLTMLNAFNAYLQKDGNQEWCYKNFLNHRSLKSALDIREQLRQIMTKQNIPMQSDPFTNLNYYENIKKCLLSGFFMHIARLQKNGTYLTIEDSQIVALHPSSVFDHKPAWILYNEFVLTKKNYVR